MNGPESSKPQNTESLARMCSDDVNDTGLNEEPVGRKKSLVVHQTIKPNYKTMDESFSRNCKISLVLEKKMAKDENQCKYIDDYASSGRLDTGSILFERNSSENQTELPEECINVYDLAKKPSDSELPQRGTFLKDLTSKLSSLKKY